MPVKISEVELEVNSKLNLTVAIMATVMFKFGTSYETVTLV